MKTRHETEARGIFALSNATVVQSLISFSSSLHGEVEPLVAWPGNHYIECGRESLGPVLVSMLRKWLRVPITSNVLFSHLILYII